MSSILLDSVIVNIILLNSVIGIVPKMEAIALDEMYKRIEQLCREAGVNVTTMCREAGVPRSALSDYKAGRIKSLAADKLAKIAGYSTSRWTICWAKKKSPPPRRTASL